MRNKLCKKCANDGDCIYEGIRSETYFTNPERQQVPIRTNGRCPDFEPMLNFEDYIKGGEEDEKISNSI